MKLEEIEDWLYYSRLPRNDNVEDMWASPVASTSPLIEHEERLSLFEGYLSTMERFLEQERQTHQQNLHNEFENLEKYPNYGDGGDISYYGWLLDVTDEFADTLRKSFFVNLYGYWESQLFPLCNSLKELDDEMRQFQIGDAKDFRVEHVKPFLKKIGFPTGGNTWSIIKKYGALRNCIAHHNGEVGRVTGKDRGNLEMLILSEQPLLSLKGQGDIFLTERDRVIVREGTPQFYSKKTLSDSKEINFKKGDVFLDRTRGIVIFAEDFTFRRDKKHSSVKVNILEEGEKIIFREGETVTCHPGEPVNFQRDEAVIFRDGQKVIFRQKVIFQDGSELLLNEGFCEKALKTIKKYFGELLDTLANWDSVQRAS